MEKRTSTRGGFVAGMKAGAAALAAVASLHLGVVATAAQSPQFTVPLCASLPTGESWGHVGAMTAKGNGITRAASFDVAFTDKRIGHDGSGRISVLLYATANTFANPIGGGTLTVDRETGLVRGSIKLYQSLELAKVNLATDTFRVEGGGLNPDKGILDCVSE